MNYSPFHFKKFSVYQEGVAHPVGTDGVLLGAWADISGANTLLDIGTGTGVIALMLAQRTGPTATITAIDLHPASVSCAQKNFDDSTWSGKLSLHEQSIQAFAKETHLQFDLIVSNPPFFSETTLSPNPERRLGRSMDSLNAVDLLEAVQCILSPNGKLCLVLPKKEGRRLCELAVPLGLFCTKEVEIFSKPEKPMDRLLLQLERDPGRFKRETLVVCDREGNQTEHYKSLAKDFYLAF